MAHRNNVKFFQEFSELVRHSFPAAIIDEVATSGLCSFYAEDGGLLMGYELRHPSNSQKQIINMI